MSADGMRIAAVYSCCVLLLLRPPACSLSVRHGHARFKWLLSGALLQQHGIFWVNHKRCHENQQSPVLP